MDLGVVLLIVQLVSGFILSIPIVYWGIANFILNERSFAKNTQEDASLTIILPMRNEEFFVEEKISSVIEEIKDKKMAEIIVVDSNSSDKTVEVAREVLNNSNLISDRWDILSTKKSGKSHAINYAMRKVAADIIVVSDADAIVSKGWFNKTLWWLSKEDVGAISGVEKITSHRRGFKSSYRSIADGLRIKESKIYSTPILEGSFLAFKRECLGDFLVNEKANADDTQISLRNIEMGYRSVIDPDINFQSMRNADKGFTRSIRRSQGLSRALVAKSNLIFKAPDPVAKIIILGAFSTYVIFPWSLAIFIGNSVTALSLDFGHTVNWPYLSLFLVFCMLFIGSGRSLLVGAGISLIAHFQYLIGKTYSEWDP